jgi:hypothetical protein
MGGAGGFKIYGRGICRVVDGVVVGVVAGGSGLLACSLVLVLVLVPMLVLVLRGSFVPISGATATTWVRVGGGNGLFVVVQVMCCSAYTRIWSIDVDMRIE